MDPIRVVIADDSNLARELLRSFIEDQPDIRVVGEACNGREAVDLAARLKPDLISMDLEMPIMGGLDAIGEIMASKAIPILVVSDVADARNACEAIRRGALEVISKPELGSDSATAYVAKVRMLAGVAVITHLRSRTAAAEPEPGHLPQLIAIPGSYQRAVAIASSTGGPQALAQVLPCLPTDFPWPILVSQHISDGFAAGMVEWLGSLCRMPVRLATHGELIRPGTIYVSPSEASLTMTAARTAALLPRNGSDIYHPSCDALLRSVAATFGPKAIGIILTGMGHDGADGLADIRTAGGETIAQDEASSVIFGMNGIAVARGAAQRVLPVAGIAPALLQLASQDAFMNLTGSRT